MDPLPRINETHIPVNHTDYKIPGHNLKDRQDPTSPTLTDKAKQSSFIMKITIAHLGILIDYLRMASSVSAVCCAYGTLTCAEKEKWRRDPRDLDLRADDAIGPICCCAALDCSTGC
jgi:hypothetical protein